MKKLKDYKRECPQCKCEIVHKSYRSMWLAKKRGYSCKKCGIKRRSLNPNWKNNIKKNHAGSDGQKNGMYGKTVYELWVKKYGKEKADTMMLESNKKKSRPGKLNGMYGKPSPKGSGNGWSGWYKDWFFRSLRELSYMINVIEKNNFKWTTGELKQYAIEYINFNGQKRNYFPDFVINEKIIIEIKPKKLHTSYDVQQKVAAALKFCKLNNFEYKLEDISIIEISELKILYSQGLIKFTDRTLKKFLEY